MELTDVTLSAFKDELEKIGGGMARSGRSPLLAGNASSKGFIGRASKGLGKFFKGTGQSSLLKKMGAAKPPVPRFTGKHIGSAALAGGALAIYGQGQAKKAITDYQTGRAMRKAQEQ